MSEWTHLDLRRWRDRMRWTQKQAAEALGFHVHAYKKLEYKDRRILPRLSRFCLLLEREHVRALYSVSAQHGRMQVFAPPGRVVSRMEVLSQEGRLKTASGPRLRYLSMFAGIEAATAAFERIGSNATAVAFSETDPAANAVLRYRWPDVPRLGDVREFDWSQLRGHVDLVVGGPPCQPYSVAGRRLGLSDPRGNLTLHMLRAIGAIQPRWFLLENVPGLLSANGGDDFGLLSHAVEELGFSFAWAVLDAADFGLPQVRRRLWLVGERSGDGRGPESILDIAKGACRPAVQGLTAWQTPARRAARCAESLSGEVDVDWSDCGAWAAPGTADSHGQETGSFRLPSLRSGRAPRQKPGSFDLPDAAPCAEAVRCAAVGPMVFAASMRNGTLNDMAPTVLTRANSLNSNPCLLQLRDGKPALRRFTPRECLRLQGFDDDWLDGPTLAGKPLSDTDRYRLAGNSWPVPVAAWVLERLLACDSDVGRR